MRLGPTELMLVVGVIVLLFGTSRLPKLARSLKEAREELNQPTEPKETEKETEKAEQAD
jgi:sec-independent protein translocase protein TatA